MAPRMEENSRALSPGQWRGRFHHFPFLFPRLMARHLSLHQPLLVLFNRRVLSKCVSVCTFFLLMTKVCPARSVQTPTNGGHPRRYSNIARRKPARLLPCCPYPVKLIMMDADQKASYKMYAGFICMHDGFQFPGFSSSTFHKATYW